jgi:hypothetical protein
MILSIALERCQQYNIFTKIQAGRTRKAYAKKYWFHLDFFYLYRLENASFLHICFFCMITYEPAIFPITADFLLLPMGTFF